MTEPAATYPPMQREATSACDVLLIKSCDHCGQALPPNAVVCTTCGRIELSTAPAAGTATLVSWTVEYRAPNFDCVALVPYTIGLVELTEGPWLYSRILGAPSAGMALRAEFVHTDEGECYPIFVALERDGTVRSGDAARSDRARTLRLAVTDR
jgi:uncharacterized OB-fold protein